MFTKMFRTPKEKPKPKPKVTSSTEMLIERLKKAKNSQEKMIEFQNLISNILHDVPMSIITIIVQFAHLGWKKKSKREFTERA